MSKPPEVEKVTLCEIISLENYYRYGYGLLLLKLTRRLLILYIIKSTRSSCRTKVKPLPNVFINDSSTSKKLLILSKVSYYRCWSSCGTLLVGGFRGADIVGRINDGSFFWVSDKIEGNGCLLIIKRVLFPFLFKNRSSKFFSQMKLFFSLLISFRCKNVIHRSLRSSSFGNLKIASVLWPL